MPGCAGLKADENGTVVWRAYLDPVAKTGLDRAIEFSPQP
jgi:hypothetical protein